MRIRTPKGAEVPFETVAKVHFRQGATEIRRLNRKRVVEVTGDVDSKVTNAQEVIRKVEKEMIPKQPDERPAISG